MVLVCPLSYTNNGEVRTHLQVQYVVLVYFPTQIKERYEPIDRYVVLVCTLSYTDNNEVRTHLQVCCTCTISYTYNERHEPIYRNVVLDLYIVLHNWIQCYDNQEGKSTCCQCRLKIQKKVQSTFWPMSNVKKKVTPIVLYFFYYTALMTTLYSCAETPCCSD